MSVERRAREQEAEMEKQSVVWVEQIQLELKATVLSIHHRIIVLHINASPILHPHHHYSYPLIPGSSTLRRTLSSTAYYYFGILKSTPATEASLHQPLLLELPTRAALYSDVEKQNKKNGISTDCLPTLRKQSTKSMLTMILGM